MATTTAKAARLDTPNGSHHLTTDNARGRTLFSKEELYPVVEIDLPRVGTVRAQFAADRYVASSYDEETNTSTPVWTDWRVYARNVEPSHGVGDAARSAINEAGRPLILEWLDSPAYLEARKDAARNAVRRLLADASRYSLDYINLDQYAEELRPEDLARFHEALKHLKEAAALLAA